jgi:ribosome-binding ATPase
MKLGIIGLPQSGKTTVFNALTGRDLPTGSRGSGDRLEVATGVVNVPDARVDDLSARFRPKKTVFATVTFTDIGGLDEGIGASGIHGPLRNELAKVDGFVHVVRAFGPEGAGAAGSNVDPRRDRATLEAEFILADLVTVEHRLARLASESPRAREDVRRAGAIETELMDRLHVHLESERPLREFVDLTTAERKTVRGYGLLSLRPMLVLHNVADTAPWSDDPVADEAPHTRSMALHGRLEAEIAQLPQHDREVFLAGYGIAEAGIARVIRAGYALLGLQSFFTVGEDEVRAWTVHEGASAVEAAATIHTDLGRGFIRAEVTAYDDLVEQGDMKAVKAAGRQRLEGRDYRVRDGDILTIRSGV